MTSGLLKGILVVVLVACIGVMIYTIVNAIYVSKRNKAKDEATRQIFLAKLQQEREKMQDQPVPSSKFTKEPVSFTQVKPKELDYDKVEDDMPVNDGEEKHLKDFFKPID